MTFDEISHKKAVEVFDMMATPEGREIIETAIKSTLESDPELSEQIGRGFIQIITIIGKLGERFYANKDKILSFFAACDRLASMPEAEAVALVEEALKEEGRNITPGEVTDIIQQINFKKPESLLIPTTKVIQKLYDGMTDFTNGIQPVDVGGKKSKGRYLVPVEIFVSASAEALEIQKYLTPYDRQVQNGIFTLIENGYTAFTAKQVYEAFAGKTTTSPQIIGHVTRSINKQRTTLITIDWTDHAKMKGLPVDQSRGDYVATEENLLLLQRVRLRCNGQDLDGYSVIAPPILYRYSKQVGQLATIDRKLLDVPVNNTESNIILKNYLLERIDTMKKADKAKGKIMTHNIAFETLYSLTGTNAGNGTQTSRIRKAVSVMLDTWKKEDYIKGYTVNKRKQEIISVTIRF